MRDRVQCDKRKIMTMWFKQLSFYVCNKDSLPSADLLAEKVCDSAFVPVSGQQWFNEGFVPPFAGNEDEWVMNVGSTQRVTLRKEEKVLPASVIRDALAEKVEEIQNTQARQVGNKEKKELKEEITQEFLPRAFCKSSHTNLLFEAQNGFLMVNQAAKNKAENAVSRLREALGDLDARLPDTVKSPSSLMTEWILQGAAEGFFDLDSDCELKGSGDVAATVRVSREDLSAEEVVNHVKNDKTVTQLGLIWQDKISFIFTHEFTFKRIRFLDVLQEEAANEGEDAHALAQTTQLIGAQTLAVMIAELVGHLGGFIQR